MSDTESTGPNEAESTVYSPKRLLELLDAVCDKDTFLNFVDALSRDAEDAEEKKGEFSPNGWEQGTIGSFLYALVRCADAVPSRYSEEPSWNTLPKCCTVGKSTSRSKP